MLALDGIGLSLGGHTLLEGFSLTLPDPGVYIFNGPVASGKSLLARVFAGMQRPQRGTMRLDGEPVYPRLGAHPGGQWYADGCLERVELETLEEYAAGEMQQQGGSAWELRQLWDTLGRILPGAAELFVSELSAGQIALFQIALAQFLHVRMLVLDGHLGILDPHNLSWAYEVLKATAAKQERYIVCTALQLALPPPPELIQLHLSGRLPVEINSNDLRRLSGLAEQGGNAVHEAVQEGDEETGTRMRLKLEGPEPDHGISSGAHFRLLGRREGWLRVQLNGSVDGMLAELGAQGVKIAAIEWRA